MIRFVSLFFCVISTVTCGYGSVNKSVSLYSVRAITEKERIKNMDNVTGNCTSTKANITVKAVFDGNQSGQQAFMKLIQRKYRTSETDAPNSDIDKTIYRQSNR